MGRIHVAEKCRLNISAEPSRPGGHEDWVIYNHMGGGEFEFNPLKLDSHSTRMQDRGSIQASGEYILKRLIRQRVPVINAHVHSFYVRHPWLIPKALRGLVVYSWGTIYCDGGGKGFRIVRCFYLVGGEIREDSKIVEAWDWRPYDVAGMLPNLPALSIR